MYIFGPTKLFFLQKPNAANISFRNTVHRWHDLVDFLSAFCPADRKRHIRGTQVAPDMPFGL